ESALAPREVPRLAGGFARAGRIDDLEHDLARVLRVLLEPRRELLVDERFDEPFDLAVAELGLGLTFELRLGHLHGDDAREALADVLALKAQVLGVLPEVRARQIRIDGAC